uniref:Uncharacterized protein n=1 Tax=Zea mays TaxID=4577 RepID=B8A220_MAIZE|nr:unknown [Zea mays]
MHPPPTTASDDGFVYLQYTATEFPYVRLAILLQATPRRRCPVCTIQYVHRAMARVRPSVPSTTRVSTRAPGRP